MVPQANDLAAMLVRRAWHTRRQDEARLSRARAGALRVLRAGREEGTIERAWLIGSAAWGRAHGRSDVDVVVAGIPRDRTGALWDRLSQACGLDVDLLRFEELEPRFRERVLSEGLEVHGS